MDLKGSLVDTSLRIYPSQNFTDFLKTLPDHEDIPPNILRLIGSNNKSNVKVGATRKSAQFNDEDIRNINKITEFVKANTVVPENHKIGSENGNKQEHSRDMSDDDEKETLHMIGKEKMGDTPEKQPIKDVTDKEFAGKENGDTENEHSYLTTSDIDWLYNYLQNRRSQGDNVPYLHSLLEGGNIKLPENRTVKRNPELEARCVKLRAQQQAREYRKMTKTVDNVRMKFPEDSISYQMKQLNRQLIAVGQFLISIFAGFLFGFRGVEWMVGNLDFGFRLLLGVMCALVIALAEIYFLAKKLNEELNIPETVQLGGPVKFAYADEHNYRHLPTKDKEKEHQD